MWVGVARMLHNSDVTIVTSTVMSIVTSQQWRQQWRHNVRYSMVTSTVTSHEWRHQWRHNSDVMSDVTTVTSSVTSTIAKPAYSYYWRRCGVLPNWFKHLLLESLICPDNALLGCQRCRYPVILWVHREATENEKLFTVASQEAKANNFSLVKNKRRVSCQPSFILR